MEVLSKAAGLVLVTACVVLLIRRTIPEFALAVSIGSVTVILLLALPLLRPLEELKETVNRLFGTGDVYLLPVIKCCLTAVVARITADLCRESSQNAAASAIEWIGILCALGAAMPLVRTMLSTIGEML